MKPRKEVTEVKLRDKEIIFRAAITTDRSGSNLHCQGQEKCCWHNQGIQEKAVRMAGKAKGSVSAILSFKGACTGPSKDQTGQDFSFIMEGVEPGC